MKLRFLYRAWKARYRDQRLEIKLARTLIEPGDTVVDAGANKGAYAYWLQQAVGARGTVLAFEPQPALAEYLERARAAFNWSNVKVSRKALSDTNECKLLHIPGGEVSPGASLEPLPNCRKIECQTSTLDTELQLQPITFMKVDVEGHELALFKGAEQTLARHQPVLLFECEARHLSRHRVHDVFHFLEKLGYEGYLLHEKRLLPVASFDPQVHQKQVGELYWNAPGYFNNFLFGPPQAISRVEFALPSG